MFEYNLNLKTAPATEPITLQEAKDYLRVDHSDDDTLITSLIVTARQQAELFTNRAFITQTWQMFFECWPYRDSQREWEPGLFTLPVNFNRAQNSIEIPLPPLISVTHIKFYFEDGTDSTLDSANYQETKYTGVAPLKGKVTLNDNVTIPTNLRNDDGIEIEYQAGYGNASAVPDQIKTALLEEIKFRYENRGVVCKDGSSQINSNIAEGLLNLFKIYNLK